MVHPTLTYPHLDIKLDGHNYGDWAISMEMLFDGLNILNHIEDLGSSLEMKTIN